MVEQVASGVELSAARRWIPKIGIAEAEIHRLKGDLLLCELRATTSLARLLHLTGRGDEPRAMLAEMYDWFTEGFDPPN
jgi:hypothetical protein